MCKKWTLFSNFSILYKLRIRFSIYYVIVYGVYIDVNGVIIPGSPFFWLKVTKNMTWASNEIHFDKDVVSHPCPIFKGGLTKPPFMMMTSSNGNIFRVTGHLCGEFTGHGEFPTQRPVPRSFDVFFGLRLNKRLSKQWWGWWFETLSRLLWRHRNGS